MRAMEWPSSNAALESFINETGLTPDTAIRAVVLGYYAKYLGLPQLYVVSGRRSREWAIAAQQRWDRGDRSGLVARPAINSDHNTGRAFDVGLAKGKPSANELRIAGEIGEALGLTWGGRWKDPDPVHFSLR